MTPADPTHKSSPSHICPESVLRAIRTFMRTRTPWALLYLAAFILFLIAGFWTLTLLSLGMTHTPGFTVGAFTLFAAALALVIGSMGHS